MQKALNGGKIQLYTYIFIYIHFFTLKSQPIMSIEKTQSINTC